MSRDNIASRRSGFTLVEMLIIAPIALLVITGFIALMVTMVGDVIANRNSNAMTYDIQSALNTIERDVRLSTEFLASSGTMLSPQGKNGATSAFTSGSGDLILGTIATDKNPLDPTRSFIHYKTPRTCGSAEEYQNRIFFLTVIYTVRGGSLWRRTYVPSVTASDLCKQPWQVNTCAPGYPSSATRCQANDSEILKNIKNFNVGYYLNPEDTIPASSAAAPTASSIRVSIEGEQTAAGRTISASSAGRSTKLSSREINLAPPASPVVSGSASGRDAIFTWPSVPTASSYMVQYNNGGSWITATENTTENIFSVQANRGATVSVKVFARNTTGMSADTASNGASVTLPLTNLMPDFSKWTLSGTAAYNAATGELTFGTSGSARSPLVRVDQPKTIYTGGDMFATNASANASLAPQGGWHVSIFYYGSDGVTAAQNTGGYTSNGCARAVALNAWQYGLNTCSFSGGPNVVYAAYVFNGPQSGYASTTLKIKNPLLQVAD